MENSDQLLIQASLCQAHLNALTDMTLGALRETLTSEQFAKAKETFCDQLLSRQIESLRGLEELLSDPTLLLRQEFEVISAIQTMRKGD